ncbi:MAG: hypothetical protein KJZ86_26135 [Caldilineaceae bacterium]|nr:hypothetical protein [Caldilineaceae bacterium]
MPTPVDKYRWERRQEWRRFQLNGVSNLSTGHPTDRNIAYFGGCAGGVWKTTDGGTYWENISDSFSSELGRVIWSSPK